MPYRHTLALALVLAPGAVIAASAAAGVESYALPRTEVHALRSERTGQDHLIYVSRPRQLDEGSGERYPTIYLLDADYSFAIAHNVVEHFVDRGDLPPMLLVGIAYPGRSQDRAAYRRHRSRDYTPTHTLEGGYGPAFQEASGNGPQFRDFIVDELAPWIERRYPADPEERMLVGHSYGGLFTTFVMLTRPKAFRRYLAVSPSYWYDDRAILRFENAAAKARDDLPVRAALVVGELEHNGQRNMVEELRLFVDRLRSRRYPGLELYHHVFEDETHNSVFPAAFSRGVRKLFEPRRGEPSPPSERPQADPPH